MMLWAPAGPGVLAPYRLACEVGQLFNLEGLVFLSIKQGYIPLKTAVRTRNKNCKAPHTRLVPVK